ncbi:hypothetical protein [Caldicellulosiruptor morganii]|uniref:DUF4129 domain-containing protein n=1 Tax=Caldicellulosiruptor morganii TaxID=1387555 RepID=A0ABY7BMN7_9FIRM|nr:hypothetical protein [Caldicellulosiruptor morganii]WAM34113.1 hypothetical protein OTK00_000278 [Caldicellulosiruptor morganii]
MENANQFITKYIYLFAITSLIFPVFMMFSSLVMVRIPSDIFISFLVMNILFLLIPYLIKKRSTGLWEKALNILFIIIIPQGYALIVLKPYGIFEMLIGQIFCMGLYIHSYLIYEKEEVSISFGAILAGLWTIIIVGALSKFMNVPDNIIKQYTTYSIIFLITSVYLSNRVNLENILSRKYRRTNSISTSISFINMFLSIGFIVILLLLFRFKGITPYIVDFILRIIRFIFAIIKKIIEFLSLLLAPTKPESNAADGLSEFLRNMKSTKKSLLSQILDIIGHLLTIGILGFLIYKALGLLKNIIGDFIRNLLILLGKATSNIKMVERGQNYTDVKTFIFAKRTPKTRLQKKKIGKINIRNIPDLNLRLRMIFKVAMEYFYFRKNYNLKPTLTPSEMCMIIKKGEFANGSIIEKLVMEYNKVRYNKNYSIESTRQFEEFFENLK